MSTKEKKLSLSDRFGTIKTQVTLQDKLNLNSDLVKKLQLQISKVVKNRQGNGQPESLAEKIGKDETECRAFRPRHDESMNVVSSQYQNIKVQVTVKAKCDEPSTIVSHDNIQHGRISKTKEEVPDDEKNNLVIHQKFREPDNEQFLDETSNWTNISNNAIHADESHPLTKSFYSFQQQENRLAPCGYQKQINKSPGKITQSDNPTAPLMNSFHPAQYMVKTPSSAEKSKGILNTEERNSERRHDWEPKHNAIPVIKASRNGPPYEANGNGTLPNNLFSGFSPISSSYIQSEHPSRNNNENTSPVCRSPLEVNYSQKAQNNHGHNKFISNSVTSPNYHVTHSYQHGELFNGRNDFPIGQVMTSHFTPVQMTGNRENSFRSDQFHSPFNVQGSLQTNVVSHSNQTIKISPSNRQRRTPTKTHSMQYRSKDDSRQESQNCIGFSNQRPIQTLASQIGDSDQHIDNHMGYAKHSLKRRSPNKPPDRLMIPAKKRMMNEYLGQTSNDPRNVREHTAHELPYIRSTSDCPNFEANCSARADKQGFGQDCVPYAHGKMERNFHQRYM